MLKPSDQLIGAGHRLYLSWRLSCLPPLRDSLHLQEVQEQTVRMRGVAVCRGPCIQTPPVCGDAEREGRLELRRVVLACGQRTLVLGQGAAPGLLVGLFVPTSTSATGTQRQDYECHHQP